jgi:hypothetical protein
MAVNALGAEARTRASLRVRFGLKRSSMQGSPEEKIWISESLFIYEQ